MKKIVDKRLLDLYDRYEGDFSLLDEPWASKSDRGSVSPEQTRILGEYVEQLNYLKVDALNPELRRKTLERIDELEQFIEPDVVDILKRRFK